MPDEPQATGSFQDHVPVLAVAGMVGRSTVRLPEAFTKLYVVVLSSVLEEKFAVIEPVTLPVT